MDKKILIIEDDIALCKLYKIAFEQEKFQVIEAHDGKVGLAMALQGGYDLFIIDLMMPVMNGFDVLKRLKETETTKNIPVIILTNLTGPEVEESKKLGAIDCLLKASLTPVDIVSRVKQILAV